MSNFLFLQQAYRNSWQQYLSALDAVQPFVDGGKLAGGGFAFFVAKEPEAIRRMQMALANRFAGTRVGLWPSAIPATVYQLATE
jgi:hypothetical protein